MNAQTLENQIVSVNTDICRQRAKEMRERLLQEDGVTNLFQWFESHYSVDQNTSNVTFEWRPDGAVTHCANCNVAFSIFVWKRHCRSCGNVFCSKCTVSARIPAYNKPENACVTWVHERSLTVLSPKKTPPPHTHDKAEKKAPTKDT